MNVIERLLAAGPVVTDGAWGTQLQAQGLPAGECPDLWNIARPDAVAAVARAYVDAGSQVILTNTFRSTRFTAGERVGELSRAGWRSRAAPRGVAPPYSLPWARRVGCC